MAEDKKISTEKTENDIPEEEKDSLDSLRFDDDEDYGETSDEVEFDSFMADYREIIKKKIADASSQAHEEVEEEKPEEVLRSMPKKAVKEKPEGDKKVKTDGSGWDEKITLSPEEYESLADGDEEMHESEPDTDVTSIEIGEDEPDESFQLSMHFGTDEDSPTVTDDNGDESATSHYDPENPRPIDWVFDVIEMFVIVLLSVVMITSFLFRHTIVDGPSMNNTLQHGDHLIISGMFYTPERGDIVVFEDYSTALKNKAVVKRVIGLPGETVEIRFNENGDVVAYINGKLLDESYAYNSADRNIDVSNFNKPIVLGDDEIFVMGDNRYNSFDSRSSSVGPIKTNTVLGKVLIRFFPFDKFGTVD